MHNQDDCLIVEFCWVGIVHLSFPNRGKTINKSDALSTFYWFYCVSARCQPGLPSKWAFPRWTSQGLMILKLLSYTPVCAKKECANYFSSSDPGPDTYLSLVSDMSSGNIYGIIFWHSIWQSIWQSILAFYLASILTFFSGILSGISSEILCSWGPVGNTLIRSSRLRSGGERFDPELAVHDMLPWLWARRVARKPFGANKAAGQTRAARSWCKNARDCTGQGVAPPYCNASTWPQPFDIANGIGWWGSAWLRTGRWIKAGFSHPSAVMTYRSSDVWMLNIS